MNSAHKSLSDRALRWVVDAIDPQAKVLSVQQLRGGVSSLVHGISLYANGEEKAFVLRQFDQADWVREEPDLVMHEAESLRRASQLIGLPTPQLLAFDETGNQCGKPAVLMTRLKGEVVLQPPDTSLWLDGMAQALARIHAVGNNEFPWTYAPYSDASKLDSSSWSKVPDEWRRAADIVMRERPRSEMRFIHRDFHPANLLWSAGEVSGVVDWVNGCIGPVGIDVGHCRVNLAQLYDVQAADTFLALYRHYAGESFTYDPYWDLVSLIDFADGPPEIYIGWTDLGVTGLTTEKIVERLDRYLMSLLSNWEG